LQIPNHHQPKARLVVINDNFITINHAKRNNKVGLISIIALASNDQLNNEVVVKPFIDYFKPIGGGNISVGQTDFIFFEAHHPAPQKKGIRPKTTKVMAVKNELTNEFFVVMNDELSIRNVRNFILEINSQKLPLLKVKNGVFNHYHHLKLPNANGNTNFQIVTNASLAIIRLDCE